MALMWQTISRIIFSNNPRAVVKQPKQQCELLWNPNSPRPGPRAGEDADVTLKHSQSLSLAGGVMFRGWSLRSRTPRANTERGHLGSVHILSPEYLVQQWLGSWYVVLRCLLTPYTAAGVGGRPFSVGFGYIAQGLYSKPYALPTDIIKWLLCQSREGTSPDSSFLPLLTDFGWSFVQ